jgi:hypothetical protein
MYGNIILLVVLYECETLSVILSEEHTQRVYENSVLSKVLRPKRDEVAGKWTRLHNELRDLYCASHRPTIRVIKSRTMRCGGHVAFTGDKRVTYKILVRKTEERYHLENIGVDGRVTLKMWL